VHEAYAQRIVFGPGVARTALPAEVERLGAGRVLLVASESARARVPLDGVTVSAVFTDVRSHVPVEVAEAARAAAVDVDLLLAVGGGAATGVAKAVALSTGLPVIAVPTTYSGSEATPVWGLTENEQKATGTDVRVLPRTVVYDPDLTVGLPLDLSVSSGLNAIAHAVDGLWAARANPVSAVVGMAGVEALATGLVAVAADETDRSARERCLLGTYLTAIAFRGTGGGLHHAVCHLLGGTYSLPHAATHAVVLPHVLAYNGAAAPRAAEQVARALNATDAVGGLHKLYRRLGAPTALRDLGMPADRLDEAALLLTRVVPDANPRPVGPDDARRLIDAMWAGRWPD
jgi:alcohol dehydrogenase class IV